MIQIAVPLSKGAFQNQDDVSPGPVQRPGRPGGGFPFGWTGSAYTFTAATTLTGPVHTPVKTSGTVDVDQQGQVRQVAALESFGQTVRKIEITFGGFGIPVAVSALPGSETFTAPAAPGRTDRRPGSAAQSCGQEGRSAAWTSSAPPEG